MTSKLWRNEFKNLDVNIDNIFRNFDQARIWKKEKTYTLRAQG